MGANGCVPDNSATTTRLAAASDLPTPRPGALVERGVDVEAAERCARDLLLALGADPDVEGLRDTPRRVASTYAELLTPAPFTLVPSHRPGESART